MWCVFFLFVTLTMAQEPLDSDCFAAGRLLICSKYYGYAFAACLEHTKLEHLKFHRSSSSHQICAAMDLCVAADFCGQSKREPVTPKEPEPVEPVKPVEPEPTTPAPKEPEPVESVKLVKLEPTTPEPKKPEPVKPAEEKPTEQEPKYLIEPVEHIEPKEPVEPVKPVEPEPKETVTPKESELVTPKPLEPVTPTFIEPEPRHVQFEMKPKPHRLNSGEAFEETPIKTSGKPSDDPPDYDKKPDSNESRIHQRSAPQLSSLNTTLYIAVVTLGTLLVFFVVLVIICLIRDARHRGQRQMLGGMLYHAQQEVVYHRSQLQFHATIQNAEAQAQNAETRVSMPIIRPLGVRNSFRSDNPFIRKDSTSPEEPPFRPEQTIRTEELESKPEPEAGRHEQPEPEPEAGRHEQPEPDPKPEPKPEAGRHEQPEPDPKPEPKPEAGRHEQPEPDPKSEQKPEPDAGRQEQPKPEQARQTEQLEAGQLELARRPKPLLNNCWLLELKKAVQTGKLGTGQPKKPGQTPRLEPEQPPRLEPEQAPRLEPEQPQSETVKFKLQDKIVYASLVFDKPQPIAILKPQISEQENGAQRKMPRAATLDRPIKRRAPPPPPVRGETAISRPPTDSKPPLGSRPPSGSRPPWASRPPSGSRPPLGSRPPSVRMKRPTQPPPPPPVRVADSRFGSQRSVMGSQSNMGSQHSGSQNFGSQNSLGYIRPVLKRTLSMPMRRGLHEYNVNEYYV